MRRHRIALAVLLYVSADFGSPFVGAAFTFDPTASIEMLQHQRERAAGRDILASLSRVPGVEANRLPLAAIARTNRHRLPTDRGPDLPRAQTFSDDPPAPSEDH
jgi:hypothetical protein